MHDDLIKWHIARLAEGGEIAHERLRAGARRHWPGGLADRTVPAARDWLRLWHPDQAATALPACSCAAGRCGVCN